MPYTFYTTPTGYKAFKKLPKSVRKYLLAKLEPLKTNPLRCPQLHSNLSFLRALHTRFQATDYRIAYEVNPQKQHIIIHYVAARENFYRSLQNLKPRPSSAG